MNQFETQPAQADASEGLFPGFPTLDLGKLFGLVVRRIWIAVAVFAGAVLLAVLHLIFAERVYESTALINIESSQSDSGVFSGLKGVKKTGYDSLNELKSIAAGLTSGSAILRVVDKLELREDPTFLAPGIRSDAEIVEVVSRRLSSELIRGERNIFLRVRDSNPERAKKIAECLITEFQEMLREQNAAVADRTREILVKESEAQAARVDQAEIALQGFREKHPDVPLDESSGFQNQKYLDIQRIASQARDDAFKLRAEYEQYLEVRDDPKRILEIGTYSGLDSIQKLILARDSKMAEFYKIQSQFTPRHPTYQAYENEVNGLNEQLNLAAQTLGESIRKRYESAEKRSESARKAVLEQAELNLQVEDIRRQFRTLYRARDAALSTYDRLLERLNDSSVTRNVDEAIIRTFSPPLVDPSPVSPKKAVTLALAGVLGGGLGLTVVLVLGLLDRSLSSRRQVESTLGLSVLAEIPQAVCKDGALLKDSIFVAKDPSSLVSEGFRGLRTSLSSLTPRSVMFTSAESGAGKSFCAANLAVLQAQFGYRTLLVDADFRNPVLSGVFKDPLARSSRPGELQTQNICHETAIANLYLISMGQFIPDGSEPLNGEHFAAMLWEAYSNFDCVIIDSSPLGLVSDGLNYSRYADAVVLVVRSNETTAGPAQEAIRELRRMRAPLSGCVLNAIHEVDPARERYVRQNRPVAHHPATSSQSESLFNWKTHDDTNNQPFDAEKNDGNPVGGPV